MGEIMNIKLEITKYILAGEFLETKKLLKQLLSVELEDLLFVIGCDNGSITAYAFVCFLIQEHETIQWHLFASRLLNIAFCHLDGAYQSSLYHLLRAIELRPNDISLKEALLLFNVIPEKIIDDSKAKKIAQEILRIKPDSAAALDVLKNK
jgi:hypothetical protein